MPDFSALGISQALTDQLHQYGVVTPTPIQERAIPHIMEGKDIIAQAQTGTGKTFAFILPILEKINSEASHVQALIVTPTRELALQITEEIEKLIVNLIGIDVLAVYGGQDVDKQLRKLKRNVQIVVGTPGRLLDHIRRETVQLSDVSFLVLDEADQMLHIGFLNEVEDIIRETPDSRQTMLFSATIPPEIRKLAKKQMRSPEYIQIEKKQGPADNVKQIAIHTIDRAKQATLMELVETHRPFLAVVFCRTKRRVSKLYEVLKSHGFSCDELHGDLSQAKRERVMKRFRDAEIQVLIATDVAARGLDVEGVTHVFNYDIPEDAESYIHRIGRTGRAGMKGLAITFYSSADRPTLDMIEKELNITIQKQSLVRKNIQDNNQKPERKQSTKDSKTRQDKQKKLNSNRNQKQSKPISTKQNPNSDGPEKSTKEFGVKYKTVKGKRTADSQRAGRGERSGSKTGSSRKKPR
ncbi:DEAD/DEAH box helicase [Neobacillus ginsengisoli]|uniref:ATP-dependent RNA helicase DeaD n=1 Tax=Neobacillus ginsengisoli TaxID=904295 RepID=A0ABT9XT14_9BACI|nr:DEAD/DEAH box helicase [Neobacillus ginsengisoli]MDQ0198692.1 ATP-dependent RNA helicase DeaD [Neobacillus ginsengisoli]